MHSHDGYWVSKCLLMLPILLVVFMLGNYVIYVLKAGVITLSFHFVGNHESSCMLANHGSAAILELIQVGLGDQVNVSAVQKALLKQSTQEVPLNDSSI